MSDQNGNEPLAPAPAAPAKKTASDFLGGAGASLVNFDNLVSRSSTSAAAGMNPFGGGAPVKSNPFQKTGPGMYMKGFRVFRGIRSFRRVNFCR